ncbi:MAG: ABC transporter ATP-binding protein [Bacteroidota bacterium]
MIAVEQLRKTFGDKVAVANLSFSLEQGQTLALVGTSGSGKTTTLKMLNRLIPPTAGRILLNGKDTSTLPLAEMRRQMGYVIQQIGLFPHYTVAENIAVVPNLLGLDDKQIKQRSRALLERLSLPPDQYLDRYPHELSGGQQQRVGIARALAASPPVLLMDEPFSALDQITRQELRRDFRELEALRQTTTVIVTHDLEEAFELADVICLMDQGELQQFDSPRNLLAQPANDFVREFLGSQQLQLAMQVLTVTDLQLSLEKPDNVHHSVFSIANSTRLKEAEAQLLASKQAAVGQTEDGQFFDLTDLHRTAVEFLRQNHT